MSATEVCLTEYNGSGYTAVAPIGTNVSWLRTL
jgi:hypothetical protein